MSIIDKAIAAVTPPESAEDRAKARAKAMAAAEDGDWLSLILRHHLDLEAALAAVENATEEEERAIAFKAFGVLLTGHSIAEEGVIYPTLSAASETGHADMGYSEQSMVKMQMAALEKLDPLSMAFADKLEHIKGALLHHMYEEEGNWFLDLKEKTTAADQEMLTERYTEEFERYMGSGELDEIEDDDEV
ncbi:MAG TPA: hemerythrin domain-containing protein [Rhizomicrobium sp.]|jgi:hemerythrin superfamily protein|nr:hemerythrin domain-containing protein [Rhizomicrobium sp.]